MWSMLVVLSTLLLFALRRNLSLAHMHFELYPLLLIFRLGLSFLSCLVQLLPLLHLPLLFFYDRLHRRERRRRSRSLVRWERAQMGAYHCLFFERDCDTIQQTVATLGLHLRRHRRRSLLGRGQSCELRRLLLEPRL